MGLLFITVAIEFLLPKPVKLKKEDTYFMALIIGHQIREEMADHLIWRACMFMWLLSVDYPHALGFFLLLLLFHREAIK